MTQRPSPAAQLALAVDIGGTNTRVALIGVDGDIHVRVRIATTPQQGMAAGLERIADAMRDVAATAPAGSIAGIGIGSPGLVDPWRGIARSLANLPGWDNVPLKQFAESACGVAALVGNDANLAALGEQRFGAGRGVADLVYFTISTGIGGGVICANQLLLGADGMAGEVGHQTVDANGPLCPCGNHGCLEILASGSAIGRTARQAVAAGAPSIMLQLADGSVDRIDAQIVARALQAGDQLAAQIVEQAGFYIGAGVTNFIHLFNPRLIVIGGGVSNLGDPLFAAIRRTVNERTMPAMQRTVTIVPAALGDDAGLLGAAALVFDSRKSG